MEDLQKEIEYQERITERAKEILKTSFVDGEYFKAIEDVCLQVIELAKHNLVVKIS